MKSLRALTPCGLLVVLTGCVAASPPPRPADFPSRATDQPPFSLHWRLEQDPGSVTATGVLDIDGYVDRLSDATVELRGVNPRGRVVSRARTRLEPRAFVGDAIWPFVLRLRPTGGEERFLLRVAEFEWRVMRPGGR